MSFPKIVEERSSLLRLGGCLLVIVGVIVGIRGAIPPGAILCLAGLSMLALDSYRLTISDDRILLQIGLFRIPVLDSDPESVGFTSVGRLSSLKYGFGLRRLDKSWLLALKSTSYLRVDSTGSSWTIPVSSAAALRLLRVPSSFGGLNQDLDH
jgi:hypothetical protein